MTKKSCSVPLMLAFAGALLPPASVAGPTVTRPIEDFVSQQGTFCVDDGKGGCLLYVPPIANYLGWTTPGRPQANCPAPNPALGCQPSLGALVDYAGLANAWLISQGKDLGTKTDGTITERPLSNGKAEITVLLHTKNALTFVVPCCDYAGGTLLFGRRALEVAVGMKPSLADTFLKLIFTNTATGAPLPDLVGLFQTRFGDIRSIEFHAQASGELRAGFGVPDGTPGRATVVQTAVHKASGKGATADGFPAEMIDLKKVGK